MGILLTILIFSPSEPCVGSWRCYSLLPQGWPCTQLTECLGKQASRLACNCAFGNGFPPGLPVTHSAPAPPTQQAVATGCPARAPLSTCMPLTPWHLLQWEESCFRLPAPPPYFLSASSTGLFPPTSPDSRPFGTAFNAGIWVFFTCSREHSVHIGVALLHPDPIRSSHSHQPATPYG